MKKGIFSLLIFFSFSVFGQTIRPFHLDNVEWSIISCMWNSGPPYVYYFTHYKLCGDTSYQGKTYKRIFQGTASWYPPFMGDSPSKPYPTPAGYSFYGLFREDSLLKETYLRLPSWTNDSLLSSYNLNVGDTINRGLYYQTYLNGPTWPSLPLKVKAEDSITVSGKKFKIYLTDSAGNMYDGAMRTGYFFIEGLGHINGVFEYGYAQEYYSHPFENCPGVDTVIFNCDCAHLSGIAEEGTSPRLDVYPVPASNHLQFTEGFDGALRIINSLGEVIMRVHCRNCKEVDVSFLLPESYLLEMESEKGIYRRKFIKH